jgi:hypothetical protein
MDAIDSGEFSVYFMRDHWSMVTPCVIPAPERATAHGVICNELFSIGIIEVQRLLTLKI